MKKNLWTVKNYRQSEGGKSHMKKKMNGYSGEVGVGAVCIARHK